MRKFLRFADCFVLLAAIIGCLLRLWLQNTGMDQKGLYQVNHPAWLLLCLVSAALIVFLWFVCRTAGNDRRYTENFRPTKVGAATYLLMGLVLTYTGVTELLDATGFLQQITAMACMLAAVMLAVTAFERFGGHRPALFLHLIPCLYFALRMFNLGRDLGTEPQICTFLFGFLGSISIMMAFYYLWAFDMGMGNRPFSLFWSLAAAYFCLIASFESTQHWVLYMTFAAFLLSNLCRLQYLPAPEPEAAPAVQEAPPEETMEETPEEMGEETTEESFPMPAEEAAAQEETPTFVIPTLHPQEPIPEEAPEEPSDGAAPADELDLLLADLHAFLGEEETEEA